MKILRRLLKNIFKEDELELFNHFNDSKREELAHKYTFGPFYQNKINGMLKELSEELYSNEPFHLIRARALFVNFLIFIIQNTSQSPGIQTNCAQKNLARVLSYINDNLEKKLTLETLSKKSNYTPDYLSKLFKKEIGATPTEFICKKRLEKACILLEESDFTIGKYTFEIGGKKKGKKQIEDVTDGYVVRDDIEYGSDIIIPLWHFGLNY